MDSLLILPTGFSRMKRQHDKKHSTTAPTTTTQKDRSTFTTSERHQQQHTSFDRHKPATYILVVYRISTCSHNFVPPCSNRQRTLQQLNNQASLFSSPHSKVLLSVSKMTQSSSSSSAPTAPTCHIDRDILNKDTIGKMNDIALSFFASACGKNRGAFVVDPPDGHTYGWYVRCDETFALDIAMFSCLIQNIFAHSLFYLAALHFLKTLPNWLVFKTPCNKAQ
jgi:hypothetical protein